MPSWWDRFGEEWARLGLHDDPSQAQGDAGFAFIGQAPPTVELFNSMFQWNDNKDNWLYGQIGNVIRSENMIPDPDDLTQLLEAITKKLKVLLTSGTTFYVDANQGNDTTGTGEQGNPWRTVRRAIQWIITYVEPAGHTCVIQLQPGTYEPFDHTNSFNGTILVRGDPANPRAYLFRNPNGAAIVAAAAAQVIVQGISVEAVGGDTDYESSGSGMAGINSGIIVYTDIAFGPCSNLQMHADTSGQVWSWGANVQYIIYGGARCHQYSGWSGVCTNVRSIVTIQNNPNFSVSFAHATCGGGVQSWYATFNGTAQGRRASAEWNGIINCGPTHPDNLYPGTGPAEQHFGGRIIGMPEYYQRIA